MNHTVVCIGELLIDFFCVDVDVSLVDGQNFQKQAGGAPANVCAAISKFGGHAVFCGKVGNDPFGHFLKKTLEDENVDTSMLMFDPSHPTTLAFVSLKANGERDFVFNRGADGFITEAEINQDKLNEGKILHFGSATALLEDPFQSTYIKMMNKAQQQGQFISFDPNYRLNLWEGNVEAFIQLSRECIGLSDFVKVSDEELEIISGVKDRKQATTFFHQLGAKVVAVTLGKDGTLISNGQYEEIIPSIKVNSIDSTGAGDAFVGATLYQLAKLNDPIHALQDPKQLKEMIEFSNRVGANVCTKVGAIKALPKLEDVL
ncbi:carbohydrate kinase family protein [Litchfieldia alkalitelluris]|uniref:carbohydrate kinase family protein n=1 Tax=Litchfieldia alkalitelluris TaxID=304268 RepID=UPI000998A3DD|nr:carbohydrate kinase [Litchfieldia alkalitelluris]